MNCRTAFENWYTKTHDNEEFLRKSPDGEYTYQKIYIKWKIWEAAWLSKAEIEQAGAVDNSGVGWSGKGLDMGVRK